jgi:hypothetical protein
LLPAGFRPKNGPVSKPRKLAGWGDHEPTKQNPAAGSQQILAEIIALLRREELD